MIDYGDSYKVWYTDYGDVVLKRCGDRLYLKKYTPLDYEWMEEYIRDNHDTLWERQESVYNWHTQDSYNDRISEYEYPYDDYFEYDSETEEYYDSDDGDYSEDYWNLREFDNEDDCLAQILEMFDDGYNTWNFEYAHNQNDFWDKIRKFYEDAVEYKAEQEERAKPHWQVFNYYK